MTTKQMGMQKNNDSIQQSTYTLHVRSVAERIGKEKTLPDGGRRGQMERNEDDNKDKEGME
jgi:hypothetical protein